MAARSTAREEQRKWHEGQQQIPAPIAFDGAWQAGMKSARESFVAALQTAKPAIENGIRNLLRSKQLRGPIDSAARRPACARVRDARGGASTPGRRKLCENAARVASHSPGPVLTAQGVRNGCCRHCLPHAAVVTPQQKKQQSSACCCVERCQPPFARSCSVG